MFSLILLCVSISAHALTLPKRWGTSQFNASVPRWEWGPPLAALDGQANGAYFNQSNGIDTWYTTYGVDSDKTPVLLLHGGIGNSNQMFNQANYLAKTRRVILQDTRGQGRSPYTNFTAFHYDDIARDALALLDYLKVKEVAVVGWSDGAITALNLAMNYTDRITRIFAHGANAQWNMSEPGVLDPIINSDSGSFDSTITNNSTTNGTTFSVNGLGITKRANNPYSCENLSPTPQKCKQMEDGVNTMWNTEPAWGPEAFAKIKCPAWIVDGDHDTAVERNQADAIAAWTPFAGELILPQVGHEALLQSPKVFNFLVEHFLDLCYDGQLPYY